MPGLAVEARRGWRWLSNVGTGGKAVTPVKNFLTTIKNWRTCRIGMTLADQFHIASDPKIRGGRSTVAGTRTRVTDILEMMAGGVSEEEIVADFRYGKPEDIHACLTLAAYRTDRGPDV